MTDRKTVTRQGRASAADDLTIHTNYVSPGARLSTPEGDWIADDNGVWQPAPGRLHRRHDTREDRP